jgi:FRG domain-containing protein
VPARRYFRLILAAHPEVEALTGRQWTLPDPQVFFDWASDYDHKMKHEFNIPGYEFLVYLRHHGFPSPLLDWSRSLYVATYFAFARANAERVAVFVYREYGKAGKVTTSSEAEIVELGPYVRGHSRHFLQQSQYTMCKFFHDGDWHFVPHYDVFSGKDPTLDQDHLWKLTAPATERTKVLRILDEHNLNAFSLFQSDEALLETLALRRIEFLNGP